jgi:hypothetical protein
LVRTTVQAVEGLGDLTIVTARRLDERETVVNATVGATLSVDYFIFKADLYSSGEEEHVEILDSNWNEHYVSALTELETRIDLVCTVDAGADEVLEVEIIDVSV